MTSQERLIEIITSIVVACRQELWAVILREVLANSFLELGVWKGNFAEYILRHCPSILRYYMLDPWQPLDQWNKPSNVSRDAFSSIYKEAIARTDFAQDRRIVLRGTTLETIHQIPNGSLDVAYVDGDHTLRGVTIDLIRTYPKIRPGGILGGDDFTTSIWQHSENYEPTLVFPFATYFAESQGAPIVVLPHNQFAIIKPIEQGEYFRVIDMSQRYSERSLLSQVRKRV